MSLILPYQLTKTAMMAIHQLQDLNPVAIRQFKNVTLNSKYNILKDVFPIEKPTLKYFGIGINGFKNIDNVNSSAPYIPDFKNFYLYEQIPFRVVPVNEDLTPEERTNYRMRVLQVIGGVSYWCYYLKKLIPLSSELIIAETDIATGDETIIDEFDESNYQSTPNLTVLEGTDSLTKETNVYVPYSALITGEEVVEAINLLKDGNLLKARISEIGLFTGVDRIVNLDTNGFIVTNNMNYEAPITPGQYNYTEALYAHLGYHYTETGTELSSVNATFDFRFRITSANAFLS